MQPVENEVQATGVTIGAVERSVPNAARRQRAARFGSQPRSKAGAEHSHRAAVEAEEQDPGYGSRHALQRLGTRLRNRV